METERLVVIEGIGGVGKTQLLLNAINNVAYHNPVVWIHVESINTLEDLHILISKEVSNILGGQVANNLLESLHLVQATFVFDGLENLLIPFRDEIEDWIYQLMTRTSNIQLLITSQIDLSIFDQQKVVIKMQGIDEKYSVWLLKTIIQSNISPNESELEWVLAFCNGHPLSIKLTASIINFYKGFGKAIEHLQKEDSLKQPLRKEYNKSNALTACLNTVYSVLGEDQLKVLHLAKFFPTGVKQEWAKSLLELDNYDYEIAVLQQFFMIDIEVDLLEMERIVVQNPLRKFLYDRSKKESSFEHYNYERELFLRISIEAMLVDHKYIETSVEGSAEYGILKMESELPNIMEAFHCCKLRLKQPVLELSEKAIEEYRLIIGNISSAVGKYFFVRGFYEQGILLAKEGINISLELEMYESASVQYIYLIQLQLRKYDYSGVEKSIHNMEKLLEVSNDSYVQIAVNWAKGRYAANRENDTVALTFYQKVEELMEDRVQQSRKKLKHDSQNNIIDEVELNEVGNLGLVYSEIGNIFENKKEFQNALEYHRKGLQILTELRDEINSLNSFYSIANCYLELNQRDKGIEFYFICIEGFLKHGNHEYLANTMAELGRNIEFNPILAKNELLTEETFLKAFDNLNYRLKHAVIQYANNHNVSSVHADSIPIGLIGQMMLLVNLTAFSDFRICLYDWALATKEEINVEQEGLNYFTAILNLAHAIGSYDYWVQLSEEERNSPLKTIFVSCLIINGGPDINSKTRVFYWLAEWFKYIKLDEEATAEKLWNQAFEYLQ